MVWILKRMYHGLPWGSWWKEAWDNGRSCFKGTWTSLSCISGHSLRVPASVLKHVSLPHCPPEVFSAHVSPHVLQLKRSLLCPSNSTHLCEFSVGLWQMPQTQWLRTIVLIRAYSSTDKKSQRCYGCVSWDLDVSHRAEMTVLARLVTTYNVQRRECLNSFLLLGW